MDAGRSLASGVARHGLAGMGHCKLTARGIQAQARRGPAPLRCSVCAVSVYTADAPAATAYARTHLPGPRLSCQSRSVCPTHRHLCIITTSLSLSLLFIVLSTLLNPRDHRNTRRTEPSTSRRAVQPLHLSTARSRDDPLIRPTRCPSPFALLPRTSTDSAPRHFHVFHFPPRLVGPAHNDLAYHPNRQRHCGHPQQGLDARPRN